MRGVRLALGLLIVILLLGVFALFGHSRDPLNVLGSQVRSETITYQQEISPATGKVEYTCFRTADVSGKSLEEMRLVLESRRPPKLDETYVFISDASVFHDMGPESGTVLVNTKLTTMQMWWVRMMHPGSNPFGKVLSRPTVIPQSFVDMMKTVQ